MRFLLLLFIFTFSFSSSLFAQNLSPTPQRPSFEVNPKAQEIWNFIRVQYGQTISQKTGKPTAPSSNPKEVAVENNLVSQQEKEVVNLVNEERKKYGLKPLKLHIKLSEVARKKSNDMKIKGYFSHQSPTYGSPFDMVSNHGISYRRCGENIAAGYQTANQVMAGWMRSVGHRQNILNPHYTDIGVGYVQGGKYGTYWTQLFIQQ